jgi:hypothetical protein
VERQGHPNCAAHHSLQDRAAVHRSQRNLALLESNNLAADQPEESMASDFPKRPDNKSWADLELRLDELEAVSGGATPAKRQQPHKYVEVQLKEVFIS